MNYRTMVKGALALSLSLTVGTAMAYTDTPRDVQAYGATFENAVNNTVGELNDYAYTNNMPITDATLHDAVAGKGWFAAEEDESKVIDQGGTNQVLQLNTDANTLTNKFASGVAGAVNTALGNAGTAFFETEVKFVASDTLDAGIEGNQDATKFAIYAYVNENVEPNTTNLVVFHAYEYENQQGDVITAYTNEVFNSVVINTEVYTKLRIEMKKINVAEEGDPADYKNVFSVSINGGAPISSALAKADGIWFQTVEMSDVVANTEVSSLNFKGTGEIDNISVGTITVDRKYAIDWTDSDGVTVTNAEGTVLGAADTNFLAGASIYFTANEGNVITNVFIDGTELDGITFPVSNYVYTVGSADATVTVLAGVPAVTPTTYAVSWAGSDKVVVSNATEQLEGTSGSFDAGVVLTFYPTEGTITNVNGTAQDPGLASYPYTVTTDADQTIVVLAGEAQEEPAQKPAWAADADDTKFWKWVSDNGVTDYATTDYTAQYLMNVDETANPVLKIDSIVVTAEGSQIVVSAADGNTAIDLAQINGVLNVSVGDTLANLTSKDPDKNATVADNKATIIIKVADGKFAKATVDFNAAATKLSQVSQ